MAEQRRNDLIGEIGSLNYRTALHAHLHAKLGAFRSANTCMLPKMREVAAKAEAEETAAFDAEWLKYQQEHA